MAQSNIVFLIDVNSIPKRQPRPPADDQKVTGDSTETGYNDSSSTELIPPAQTGTFGVPNIQWLKDVILVNLCKEANNGSGYDFGKVRWTFKFFDTSRHIDNRDGRSFSPFDTDSISHFENQVDQIISTLGTNETTQSDVQVPYGTGIKFLADAIKTITGTLQWTTEPEFQMFEMSRSFNESENPEQHPPDRNKVFVFFNVPRTEGDLLEFAGPSSSTKEFMGMLLPQAFSQIFHYKLRVQLNFVDMQTAHHPDEKWKGPYPKLIIKCLTYLGHGQISHLQPKKMESMNKIATDQGLIPYTVFLRTCLRDSVAVTQNENVLSRIKHLIPANPKSAQKVSPDLDSSSVCRKSSVLDSSMNSQSKTIRPFHMTSGYEGGGDNLEFYQRRMASIKEQDRQREREREGDRKRKRFEYEDDYDKQGRSRHHLIDDRDYGSNDADSEKEHNRLESWINDSNDDYLSKRKRHSDATSSAVPMSRAGLNKSFHVFHEPAPKLPGSSSRGTKMLATVERQKIKVSVVESKRRSTEGLDLKRIAQQQEIELRAVKRRLKLHLHGEIDDDEDPIKWMKTLKVQLGSFIDFNLQDEKPCLVALAQALVNHTSHNFPLHRLSAMKNAYRNKSLTIKELLEDILLIDFTKLNKKIITAHENNGRKESMENAFIKNLCFREVELQIILRLEIAWCFAQPDEDVTADVLTDIVRLLQIISAYRTRPPISNFMNSVLLPAYRQSSRFMRELYKRMNAPLPAQLAIDGSPIAGSSARDDDASIISSTSSANLYPEDSASQLHMHRPKKVRNSPVYNRMNMRSTNYKNPVKTGRNAKSEPKRVKRQILIGNSNPKQSSQHALDRNNSQKSSGGNVKVSPKRVRRNLFDVQKQDKKDSKLLLALSSSSRVTRSPVFKSPKGKSPSSGSGFFRAVRSRRQLVMNSESPNQHFGSPQINPAEVLCPESPATPHSVSSRYTGTNISGGSAERQRIIQESPEITKNDYEDRPMRKVASLSFYSRGVNGEAIKSRAWEKSETKLLAARIKDSVDLRTRENKELTLNDLEFIRKCPTPTHNTSGLTDTPNTSLSFCANSVEGSPMHPNTDSPLLKHFTGPAPDLDNPNIEALIKSENFRFPLNSEVALKPPQRESIGSPAATATTAVDSPGAYQTPSKRVQFNLNENLINTPSSSKHSSSGTPKSILKEAQDGK